MDVSHSNKIVQKECLIGQCLGCVLRRLYFIIFKIDVIDGILQKLVVG